MLYLQEISYMMEDFVNILQIPKQLLYSLNTTDFNKKYLQTHGLSDYIIRYKISNLSRNGSVSY